MSTGDSSEGQHESTFIQSAFVVSPILATRAIPKPIEQHDNVEERYEHRQSDDPWIASFGENFPERENAKNKSYGQGNDKFRQANGTHFLQHLCRSVADLFCFGVCVIQDFLANRIIDPEPGSGRNTGAVERRQRPGGMLNYYYHAA